MRFKTSIEPYILHFKKPAGTSRGVYQIHKVWFIKLFNEDNPEHFGIGECAPLPDLSCDYLPDYEAILQETCRNFELSGEIDYDTLRSYPSILFGFETALNHYNSGSYALWNTPFSKGIKGIPINGLIWMGELDQMTQQVDEKIRQGFKCIKIKIGAIDFLKELELLKQIRQKFTPEQIALRVDANGAFSAEDALEKLTLLSKLGIHSIEQPIRAGQWKEMARLNAATPLPIALDEELIGINSFSEKFDLLHGIKPRYIILKPTLHGGIKGCNEWIQIANELNIGWWVTSALESNIGLNAIAQWFATLDNSLHQGLGTGMLYTNNIEMPLQIDGEHLWFKKECISIDGKKYYREDFLQLRTFNPECFTAFHLELFSFLKEWFDDSEFLTIHTSGSTGHPKPILVQKKYMLQSAEISCHYFGLKSNDKVLLSMPLSFIAGKMMVVRALYAGLDIYPIQPSGHPLKDTSMVFDFAAMVPMQIFNSLQIPLESERLRKIGTLLIGGGVLSPDIEEVLYNFPNPVYHSYGMAETLSHIAMRRVNGANASLNFTPLPYVTLKLSEEGTLLVDAPKVAEQRIVTNDFAEIYPDGTFQILGRKDNIIQTGGIKIQIETLESILSKFIDTTFAITSLPDSKFGEIIILVVEKYIDKSLLDSHLLPYQRPKRVIQMDRIPRTESGKINRLLLKEFCLKHQ